MIMTEVIERLADYLIKLCTAFSFLNDAHGARLAFRHMRTLHHCMTYYDFLLHDAFVWSPAQLRKTIKGFFLLKYQALE